MINFFFSFKLAKNKTHRRLSTSRPRMALKSCQSGSFMKVFQRMDLLITPELGSSQETISRPPSCVEPSIVIVHWCSLPQKMWQPLQERTKQWAARPSRRCPLLFEQNPTSPGRERCQQWSENSGHSSRCCSGHGHVQEVSRRSAKNEPSNARWIDVTVTTSSVTRALRYAIHETCPVGTSERIVFEKSSPGFGLRPLLRGNNRCARPLSHRTNTSL